MAFDEIISLLGDFGKYQQRIYFLLCLPAILCAFHKFGNVFTQAKPDYRCQLPFESTDSNFTLSEEELTKYYDWDSKRSKFSDCSYNYNNETIYCDNFIYDKSVYESSNVMEWNMVCKRSYMRATTDSLFMVGVMLGSIIFGELSDRFGRKLIFFISLVLQVVFGFIAAFAPEYWTYTIARLIVGGTTSGVFLVAYVIALEMVGPKKRLVAGTIMQMFFSIGYMLTALFAYLITDWRNLQMALTVPGIVFLTYWWLIPESTRWLLTHHKIDKAKVLIQKVAKVNKVTISDQVVTSLLKEHEKPKDKDEKKERYSVLDLFKYPSLRKRSLIIFFDWFANSMTYYGLSWNTSNLGGNDYINFVISGAVEIPAYCFVLLTLNKYGRKNILCGCMLTAGVALLVSTLLPANVNWLVVTLAMVGKLAITASYGVIYLFSTEQFPTVIRNAGLGAGSTSARVGSVLAPIINVLADYWKPIPLIVFGACAFTGGLLSMMLPETLGRKLPETFEEGETFGKEPPMQKDVNDEEAPESIPLQQNGTAVVSNEKETNS